MPLTKIFKKFRVPYSLEKEIAQNNPITFINERTLHLMKLMLVQGAWIKSDDGVKHVDGEESNSFASFTNETLTLLHSFHLK